MAVEIRPATLQDGVAVLSRVPADVVPGSSGVH